MCKSPEAREGRHSGGSETSPQGCSKLGWEVASETELGREMGPEGQGRVLNRGVTLDWLIIIQM